jgi:hypothetical protein
MSAEAFLAALPAAVPSSVLDDLSAIMDYWDNGPETLQTVLLTGLAPPLPPNTSSPPPPPLQLGVPDNTLMRIFVSSGARAFNDAWHGPPAPPPALVGLETAEFAARTTPDATNTGSACPVCLEPGPDTRLVACPPGHAFHRECLATWCAQHPHCPLCRRLARLELAPARPRLASTNI